LKRTFRKIASKFSERQPKEALSIMQMQAAIQVKVKVAKCAASESSIS
jgi:hypothetical protein